MDMYKYYISIPVPNPQTPKYINDISDLRLTPSPPPRADVILERSIIIRWYRISRAAYLWKQIYLFMLWL